MVDTQYKKSCTEVIEILKHISSEDYEKIPPQIVNVLETDKDNEYHFEYDINKTLNEQNVSKQAKIIIALFFRDYWATEEQREVILVNERKYRNKIEKEKREKYNPYDLFKDGNIQRDETIQNNDINQNMQIIEYKESALKKIEKWLKNLFKANKNKFLT